LIKNNICDEVKLLVWALIDNEKSFEEIADLFDLEVGTRYQKGTVKWYNFCKVAKENQKKAFEKYGVELYRVAGNAAQKKHPWIGHELGKKYAQKSGKERMKTLRANGQISSYFSYAAKQLQKKYPNQSRNNMKKAHKTMKQKGTFKLHQKQAAIACLKKHPLQLKEMSMVAHSKHNLVELSRISRRNNSPYLFMGCVFDSNQEKQVCEKLVEAGLIDKPIEGKNIHFKINNYEIDFFIQRKIFLEFHPAFSWGYKKETNESYRVERQNVINSSAFCDCELFIINDIRKVNTIISEIKNRL